MTGYRIAFTVPGEAALETYQPAAPGPEEVLLANEYTVVSAGTERANLLAMPHTAQVFPHYPGYCAAARVMAAGARAQGPAVGSRVIVYHGGHASYSVKRGDALVPVPDAVPSLDACMTVIASMGLQGVRKTRLELGESVLVSGLGLLGLFAVQAAKLSGGMPVIALDFDKARRELACTLGADYAFSPDEENLREKVLAVTRGRGVQAAIEVSGSAEALPQALALMAPRGRISFTGCTRVSDAPIDFYQMVHKPGITIIGAHNFVRPPYDSAPGYWTREDDYRTLLDLMAAGRLQVAPLISQVARPEDAAGVYARLAKDACAPLGVVFDWKSTQER